MASYQFNPINILDTSNAKSLTEGGSMTLGGGISIGKDALIGGNVSISGTTTSFSDNILLINKNPTQSTDTGIIFQRYTSDIQNNNNYAGIIYSEQNDTFNLGYLVSDADRNYVSIGSLISLNTKDITTGNVNMTGNLYKNGTLYNPGSQWVSVNSDIFYTSGKVMTADLVSTNISGTNLRLSGDLYVGGTLTTLNVTTTNVIDINISTGTINASGLSSLANVTATNASVGVLVASTGITTGNINVTSLATINNATVTTATVATLLTTDVISTNVSAGSVNLSTGITAGSARITNANVTTATVGTLVNTNATVITATVGTLINTNAVSTNVSSGTMNVSTGITAGSARITNANITNVTAGDAKITNLSSTNSSIGSFVSGAGTVGGHLVPSANITYDIGSATQRWRDIYLSGNTIYLGDKQLSLAGDTFELENISVISTKEATSTTSAALVVSGGVGIRGKLRVAGTSYIDKAEITTITASNIVASNVSSATFVASTGITTGTISASGVSSLANVTATNASVGGLNATGLSSLVNSTATNVSVGVLIASTGITAASAQITNIVGTTISAGTILGNISSANIAATAVSAGSLLATIRVSSANLNASTISVGTIVVAGNILSNTHTSISNQGIHLAWNRSNVDGESWIINQKGGGTANSGIRFGRSDTSNNVTELMRIQDSGNVGIGTNNPGTTLDVSGTFRATTSVTSGALYATNVTATNIVGTTISAGTVVGNISSANIAASLITAGTVNAATLVSSANIAASLITVGTVNAATLISSANIAASLITVGTLVGSTINGTNSTITNVVNTSLSTGTLRATAIDISTTSNAPMNIASTFSAGANGYSHSIKSYNSNMATNEVVSHNIGRSSTTRNEAYFGYCYVTSGSTSNYATIGLNGVDRILNLNGLGNVGINTTSPAYTLDVNGTIDATSITTGLLNATNVTATNIVATTISAGTILGSTLISSANIAASLITTGTLNAATLVSSANIASSIITAGSLVATTITGGNLSLSGNITIGTLLATTRVSSANLNSSLISTGTLNVSNSLSIGTASAGSGIDLDIIDTTASSNAPFLRLANSAGGAGNKVGIKLNPYSARTGGDTCQIIAQDDGNASSNLLFYTADTGSTSTSTERMRIMNSGYVGIGTNNPGTVLEVVAQNNGIRHTYNTCSIETWNDGSDGWLQTFSNNALKFGVNNASASMTVNTNGNIGIGTDTPPSRTKLQVVGNVGIGTGAGSDNKAGILDVRTLSVAYSSGTLMSEYAQTITHNVTTNGSLGIAFGIAGGSGAITPGASIVHERVGTNSLGLLHFCTKSGSAATSANLIRMTIQTSGNVGIGTTAPAYTLDVTGTCDVSTSITTAALYSTNITATNIVGTTISAGTLVLSNANLSSATIGTLIGTTRVSSANIAASIISTGTIRITSNLLALGNSNTIGNIFTTGGNVGIATGTPESKLHVNGAITIEGETVSNAQVDSSNLTQTYISFKQNGSSNDWAYLRQIGTSNEYLIALDIHDDGNEPGFCIRSITSTSNPDTVNERFRVQANGNVGINTASPSKTLHVNGDILADNINVGEVGRLDSSNFKTGYGGFNVGYIATSNADGSINTYSSYNSLTRDGLYLRNGWIEVTGSVTTNPGGCNYFVTGMNLIQGTSNFGNTAISIKATGSIWSGDKFISTSDLRVKKNRTKLDTNDCLEIINNIEPVTFNFIDTIQYTQNKSYGFIAQEIEKIIPDAIITTSNFIPSIMEVCDVEKIGTNKYKIQLSKELNKNAKKIKMYDIDNKIYEADIEIYDEKKKELIISNEGDLLEQMFIYGEEILDFKTLEKDVIWTITTAAVKELNIKLQQEKQKVAILQEQYQDLLSRISNLESM